MSAPRWIGPEPTPDPDRPSTWEAVDLHPVLACLHMHTEARAQARRLDETYFRAHRRDDDYVRPPVDHEWCPQRGCHGARVDVRGRTIVSIRVSKLGGGDFVRTIEEVAE